MPFRKNTFPFPISDHVFIASWKYEQQMIYNIKPFITIKMKNKIDMYKIKFLNSTLKHNVITNTNINVKPCKLNFEMGLG